MSKKLENFHLKLKDEFKEYLCQFNLLFYGYGCKKELLKKIFPKVPIINGLTDSVDSVIEFYSKKYKLNRSENKILGLHKALTDQEKNEKIIILNFCFDKFSELKQIKPLRIIGTIERIDFSFSHQDLLDFNFIFRDLTTFISYKEEFVEKKHKLEIDKFKTLENVFLNVQKQSQIVFIDLIRLFNKNKSVYLKDLIDSLKSKLMHKEKNKYLNLLTEFVDHKIIKIGKEEIIGFKVKLNILTDFYEKYKEFNIYK
ncbi:origin recognition complex subunit 2 [Tubulinosema ratisbonensis]|uniref:Origin recognition complex subunit 2 n=1 Tax=Tubulinosema ratisbonensis TaxID=291195 RepID=A0A437AM37_9MICR|nr:origin recognition complex subunit 2 [Tubulinosema ratisbonensis]